MVNYGNLPDSLIQLILSYSDTIVYRFGKYMGRIQKSDKRYKIVKPMNPIRLGLTKLLFKFVFYDGLDLKYLIMEEIHNNNNHYVIKKIVLKNCDNSLTTIEQVKYIFDLNGKCRRINDYNM
jgi:hypothetical protein